MNRLLELASKALAVIGVLTLLYTGTGTQQAKADLPPWTPGRSFILTLNNKDLCIGGLCEILKCCCNRHGPWSDDNGKWCCDELCFPCGNL